MDELVEIETMPPPVRACSPSSSVSPTPAISSCPSPERSFSTLSSFSTSSAASVDARSLVSVSTRRHGYIRPQGAHFAESAKNRESVMSLGSIAHLQYYFARTGLLDGKGGNAREYRKKPRPKNGPRLLLTPNYQYLQEPEQDQEHRFTESPTDEILDPGDDGLDEPEEVMLPPTVSTYSIKTHHIPPPPDLTKLRKDLLGTLGAAEKALHGVTDGSTGSVLNTRPPRTSLSPDSITEVEEDAQSLPSLNDTSPRGWHEIQGMHILDVVTLAIRAARIYYTAHERPDRLAAIKSERRIREELFNVLEVLKKWAGRNFSGGLRQDERDSILFWMTEVRSMLAEETRLEVIEANERASWNWAHGDWTGRDREREASFMCTLISKSIGAAARLPDWTSAEEENTLLPTPMLERLRDGRDLVHMHNEAVRKSKRPFGQIKTFHQDIAKPYRRAENLRYWVKAAEIRWEVKLDMDVMGVVYGSNDEAWRRFDAALLTWCRTVREELMRDWQDTVTSSKDPGFLVEVASDSS